MFRNLWYLTQFYAYCCRICLFRKVFVMVTGAVTIFIVTLVKRVNNSCISWQANCNYCPKPHAFSSMPLQSAIFTINRKFIINLVSCMSTALVAYGIRFILLKYVEYDVFANIEN